MNRVWIGSVLLLLGVLGAGAALATWKASSIEASAAAGAQMPEPVETVTAATATTAEHRATTTAIGTVVALRSITLRNELPGTVREVHLVPGEIVEAGRVLVALDVSVERAEQAALEAQAALAETSLARMQQASRSRAASASEVDRALAERDVARAQLARIEAVIERKTIRAPFRARVGIADVHPGQYLDEGTLLTTLQGVSDAAHVDFSVAQDVAARLRAGDRVAVHAGSATDGQTPIEARIVAVDARVDPQTRNAAVRARIRAADSAALAPGASVRVEVPRGELVATAAVPLRALRKGPDGDHVFVLETDADGATRARMRRVETGPVSGDRVLVVSGLAVGERVAASGSFKLWEGVRVAVAGAPDATDAVASNASNDATDAVASNVSGNSNHDHVSAD